MENNKRVSDFSNLVKEWNYKKNGDLKPQDFTFGSHKKVWWICSKGHEWEVNIQNRTRGRNCPYCSGNKVCKENCLATKFPEIVKEWDYETNGDLKPEDFTYGSGKKVWWKDTQGHKWETRIVDRTICKHGNPFFSKTYKRACKENCLMTLNPELAKEWHQTKNGNLTPNDVTCGSHKKVWWIDKYNNEWQSTVKERNNGHNSPFYCGRKVYKGNCLATLRPDIAKKWHPTRNGDLTPSDVTIGSGKKVWWIDDFNHEWCSRISDICNGHDNPFFSKTNKKVCKENCLAVLRPNLAKEWHPTKNGNLTPKDVTSCSSKKVWWLCSKYKHEWIACISSRIYGERGCPYCASKMACKENCLATFKPELIKEWHPTKNNNLTPYNVTYSSSKNVWWVCSTCGYEWNGLVLFRGRNNSGCPKCNISKGERRIMIVLDKYHINYIGQYRIKKCRNKRSLPFDFKVEINNKIYLIEYQGEQHYKMVGFGTKKKDPKNMFFALCKNDKIKNTFCKKNKIPLLIIPYYNFDKIEKNIQKFLNIKK